MLRKILFVDDDQILRFAVEKHHGVRRIDKASCYRGNVTQAKSSSSGPDRDFSDIVDAFKHAANSKIDIIGRGFHHAGGGHGILCFDGSDQQIGIDAHLRKLDTFHFDEYFLWLHTYQLNFFNIGDTK